MASVTPGTLRNRCSTPQKQPAPKVAISDGMSVPLCRMTLASIVPAAGASVAAVRFSSGSPSPPGEVSKWSSSPILPSAAATRYRVEQGEPHRGGEAHATVGAHRDHGHGGLVPTSPGVRPHRTTTGITTRRSCGRRTARSASVGSRGWPPNTWGSTLASSTAVSCWTRSGWKGRASRSSKPTRPR